MKSLPNVKKSLEKSAKCTWLFGLTRKGFGLCHGISGNAYFMISMYRYSKEKTWWKRALLFGCVQREKDLMKQIKTYTKVRRKVQGVPDFPFSLQLGLAGDIYFYADLFDPLNACYPGYEL